MTTMTLTIDDQNQDILEAFKIFASKFQGVSFEIESKENKEEILKSLSQSVKEIKSGEAIKNAKPIEELYKEFIDD